MMTRTTRFILALTCAGGLTLAAHAGAMPLGNEITYQGQLFDGADPANGSFSLRFRLFEDAVGGTPIGQTIVNAANVTNGLFTVQLNFGPNAFLGDALWVELAVQTGAGFDTLAPRQPLTAAPNALFAKNASEAPGIFRVRNDGAANNARVFFGPTNDCSIGLDPQLPGLVENDPFGFRLLGPNGQGCRLLFGPTDLCTIAVDPPGLPGSLTGLILRDPGCIRIVNPLPGPAKILFGSTDNCSIGIDPAFTGLVERDPTGFRLLGQNNQGCRLIFGPTMDCTIEVQPGGPPGLLLRDPSGIRVLSPSPTQPPRLLFGPTDLCSIGIDPQFPGLVERDPTGFRLLGQNNEGCRLLFGPTMDCTIEVQPDGPAGLLLRDPSGIRVLNPDPLGALQLRFGPTDDCSISVSPLEPGLRLSDPRGFMFNGGPVALNLPPGQTAKFGIQLPTIPSPAGSGFAFQWINASSRRWKENVRPLDDALDLIAQLDGVRFNWDADHGGAADIGFIAEDVGKVLPEIVAWSDDGESAEGLDYSRLGAVAIAGIKAQQSQIQTLQAENLTLRRELDALQQQVRALLAQSSQPPVGR